MSLQSGKTPLDYVDEAQEGLRAILAVPGGTEIGAVEEMEEPETNFNSDEPVSGHDLDAQMSELLLEMHGNVGTGVPCSTSQQVDSRLFCGK